MKLRKIIACALVSASLLGFAGCNDTTDTTTVTTTATTVSPIESADPSRVLSVVEKDMVAVNAAPIWEDPYERNVQLGELEPGAVYHVIAEKDDFYAIEAEGIELGFVIGKDNFSEKK